MDFLITDDELTALCGLPHIQQLAYLRGIRPYMDVQTGLVGIKRRISYQSIAEQLYVDAHQGIKSVRYSRTQIRRALPGLERMGLVSLQSQGLKLILKCELARMGYSVQNKVVTNSSQQVDIETNRQRLENKVFFDGEPQKSGIAKTAKADTPLKDSNYIYLLSQFEQFWSFYPEKKSKQTAWQAFQLLNPDKALVNKILQSLDAQLKNRETKQLNGGWVPPWKYPDNWLAKRCWEDELTMDRIQEKHRAKRSKNTGNEPTKDMFWVPCESTDEQPKNNVVNFQRRQ